MRNKITKYKDRKVKCKNCNAEHYSLLSLSEYLYYTAGDWLFLMCHDCKRKTEHLLFKRGKFI